jgi:hypothetical protein
MTRAAFQQIESLILRFDPTDSIRQSMQHDALDRYGEVVDVRFRLVAEGSKLELAL